jgi:hypothetical protein
MLIPDFPDRAAPICLFDVEAFAGLRCVNATATALVFPTQHLAANIADIYPQFARHFVLDLVPVHQASVPAMLDFRDFDFGFHKESVTPSGFIVNPT